MERTNDSKFILFCSVNGGDLGVNRLKGKGLLKSRLNVLGELTSKYPIIFLILFLILLISQPVFAEDLPKVSGSLSVIASEVVVSAQQRKAASGRVQPKGIIGPSGFDWPDTPLGIVRNRNGTDYLFFASDGSTHRTNPFTRAGSFTRSEGTLNNLLRNSPSPIVETILPQSNQFSKNAIAYVGGGPVYRIPKGHPGAGNLLMVYHAEREQSNQSGFYSFLGIAKSTDEGHTWVDLGLVIEINQPFNETSSADFEIGDGNLVVDPTNKYFYLYFPDRMKTGVITYMSVARVSIDEFLSAAFPDSPGCRSLPSFVKYYKEEWNQPGIGGLSSMVLPGPWPAYAGSPNVAYSNYLHCYVAILDDTSNISYSLSKDGIHWTNPVLLKTFESAEYAVAVGMNEDPSILDQQFYVYFTYYPTKGADTGWDAASLQRLTISCSK